jgi:hypothetical protein
VERLVVADDDVVAAQIDDPGPGGDQPDHVVGDRVVADRDLVVVADIDPGVEARSGR